MTRSKRGPTKKQMQEERLQNAMPAVNEIISHYGASVVRACLRQHDLRAKRLREINELKKKVETLEANLDR